MLQYEIARDVYLEMKDRVAQSSQSGIDGFYKLFLKNAADYANTRTAWASMDQAARIKHDKGRTIQHDAFISVLGALSRNLGLDTESVMPDRKTKGDFACYIALFLALEQR